MKNLINRTPFVLTLSRHCTVRDRRIVTHILPPSEPYRLNYTKTSRNENGRECYHAEVPKWISQELYDEKSDSIIFTDDSLRGIFQHEHVVCLDVDSDLVTYSNWSNFFNAPQYFVDLDKIVPVEEYDYFSYRGNVDVVNLSRTLIIDNKVDQWVSAYQTEQRTSLRVAKKINDQCVRCEKIMVLVDDAKDIPEKRPINAEYFVLDQDDIKKPHIGKSLVPDYKEVHHISATYQPRA